MLQTVPQASEPATTLFVSTFNLLIALGALTGDCAFDQIGAAAVMRLEER